MRLCLATVFVLVTWKWGDWRNWRKYHPTILYFMLSNFVYEFLTYNYPLWEYKKVLLFPNHTTISLINTLVSFPCTVLLYLAHVPRSSVKRILYILLWASIYSTIELIFWTSGGITYHHGWNFWWSTLFDLVTFCMILLHSRKPLLAYGLSVPTVLILLAMFHVPISSMK